MAILYVVGGALASAAALWGALRLRREVVRRRYAPAEVFILPFPDGEAAQVVPIEGGSNFRDLGGYRTGDGQRVRRGLIYRSGTLAGLTETGVQQLADLGIRLVCDLRAQEEAEAAPDRLPVQPKPAYVSLPMTADPETARRQLRALLFDPAKLDGFMGEVYSQVLLTDNAGVFGAALNHLAEPDSLPAIVHCTAGKDRTGITAALLLLLLGVPEPVVLADYAFSNTYYAHYLAHASRAVRRLAIFGVGGTDLHPMLVANPRNLTLALERIRSQYPTIEDFLIQAAGVQPEAIARLRHALLEPDERPAR